MVSINGTLYFPSDYPRGANRIGFLEKGYNLLYHIEKTVGGPEIFEPFMKAYVEKFASQSITTEMWKDFLYEYMEKHHGQAMVDKLNTIDFDTWINGKGMPPVDPQFDTTLADVCYELAKRWDEARHTNDFGGFSPKDVEQMSATQKSTCGCQIRYTSVD